ncbi:MAG: porin [Planctomycetes bacterium]|nr:porin [Planctomycetota bacterium]
MLRHRHRAASAVIIPCLLAMVQAVSAADGVDPAVVPAPAPVPVDAITGTEARLEALDQRIRELDHKLEIAQEEASAKSKDAPKIKAGAEGFSLSSADDAFSLRIGGYIHADGRFYLNDDDRPGTDTFLLRRVRPILDGKLGKHAAFKIMTDFGGGVASVQDAYLDLILRPEAQLRVGKFKVPVSVERLQSGTALLFIERALPSSLIPNRDIGAIVHGEIHKGAVAYAAGVVNGAVDGGSRDTDVNDDKEGVARIWLSPFTSSSAEALNGLGVGIGGTYGNDEGTAAATSLPTYRSTGQEIIFRYVQGVIPTNANTARADGPHYRIVPQLYWTLGAFSVLGEYAISHQEVVLGGVRDDVTVTAWQAAGAWVLTGERASFKGVVPKQPLDVDKGTWGAFELALRVHGLEVEDDVFTNGFASRAISASRAIAYGAGLNWYLTRNLKWQANYEVTRYVDGAADGAGVRDRQDEQIALTRFQVQF